ncbi:BTAD domain-containing putative transcriptional regulator [Nonomuraea typhae]|uniref:BTAD domain-containing putative transcriptional regulator n=1 Tax=Nonomuraea typhae TaxID=2603600 RepID=A0ABW7Z865_9ACTN
MADGLFIRLLGPVVAQDGAREVELGPARQQAVLAMLATRTGEPVTTDAVIDGVWGESAPRSAPQNVHTYVAGLRRALEPGRSPRTPPSVLLGVRGGYLLDLDASRVDSLLFGRRVEEAHDLPAPDALECLERAMGLWRGSALLGLPGPFAEAESRRLEDLRLAAAERRAGLLLGLGRPGDALAGLEELARRHPLRERLWELLVRVLHRLGRPAEAVFAFEDARRHLAGELGVRPGHGLQDAFEQARRARDARRPQQLPRELLGFVGREEVGRVCALLAPPGAGPPAAVVAVTGVAGAGKSALAVHVARRLGDRFPDGRLFANLRGATPGMRALSPLEVLGRFLRTLGVEAEDVPLDLDEAVALWHSLLDCRRMLIVLDDARDPAQVRPLLSVPVGNAVLLTSRESFSCVEDCVQVGLATLSPEQGVAMLGKIVGGERCAAEPAAGRRLAELCGGLPLAIRVAGARLLDDPHSGIAQHVAQLEDEQSRLEELQAGDVAVRTSLMGSWAALAGSERARDRLAADALSVMGLLDVTEFTPQVVAALLDVPVPSAQRALARLASAHLAEHARSGSYHLHDLVRLFARELVPPQSRSALIRALGHYAATARAATALRDPHRVQPVGPPVSAAAEPFASREAASTWLAQEESNLVGAALQAMTGTDGEIAALGVAIAFALYWYQSDSCAADTLWQLNELALAVSTGMGDDRLILECHNHLGAAANNRHMIPEALWHFQRQLYLATRLQDRFCQQRALGNIAAAQHTGGMYAESLTNSLTQLAIARQEGFAVGERFALFMAGSAFRGLDRLPEARDLLVEALRLAEEAGDDYQAMASGTELGEIHLEMGEAEAALHHLTRNHERAVALNSKVRQTACLLGLATAYRRLGQPGKAAGYLSAAAALIEETDDRHHRDRLRQEEKALLDGVG